MIRAYLRLVLVLIVAQLGYYNRRVFVYAGTPGPGNGGCGVIESAGRSRPLGSVAAAAKSLIAGRESLADEPSVHGEGIVASQAEGFPVLFAVAVDVINRQVFADAATCTCVPVVVADGLPDACVSFTSAVAECFGVGVDSGTLAAKFAFPVGRVPCSARRAGLFCVSFAPCAVGFVAAVPVAGLPCGGGVGGAVRVRLAPRLGASCGGCPVFGGADPVGICFTPCSGSFSISWHAVSLSAWRDAYDRAEYEIARGKAA